MPGTVVSLCDLTGHMVEPWVDAGYRAVLVDPQHKETRDDGQVLRVAGTIEDAGDVLASLSDVVFLAGFPPCTDLAVSGARWWKRKRERDPEFQARAMRVVLSCRDWGERFGVPWMVENPVGAISQLWRKADHYFHPWHYAGLDPSDHYTKKTGLWVGGGFVMPDPQPLDTDAKPDDRIHRAAPGPGRANFRSATPRGFARAVFAANDGGAVFSLRPSTGPL